MKRKLVVNLETEVDALTGDLTVHLYINDICHTKIFAKELFDKDNSYRPLFEEWVQALKKDYLEIPAILTSNESQDLKE